MGHISTTTHSNLMNRTLLESQNVVPYFNSLALSAISTLTSAVSQSVQNTQTLQTLFEPTVYHTLLIYVSSSINLYKLLHGQQICPGRSWSNQQFHASQFCQTNGIETCSIGKPIVKKQPSQDVLHGDEAEKLGLAHLVSSYTLPHQNSQPGERGRQTARSKVLSRRTRDT